MWTNIPPSDQKHYQKELQNNNALPTLIMGLIAKTRLKIPSGPTIVPRAHIISSKTDISQIPRDNVEEEDGDIEEEIDKFTSAPKSSAQPSSQAQSRGPDCLDCLMARIEQMNGMLEPYVQHTTYQFAYI